MNYFNFPESLFDVILKYTPKNERSCKENEENIKIPAKIIKIEKKGDFPLEIRKI